jgi:hypothetical protein
MLPSEPKRSLGQDQSSLMQLRFSEFSGQLKPTVELEDGRLKKPSLAYIPHTSQQYFLASRIFEVLFEGTRGPGKTLTLLMDFCSEVGKGYGAEWRGILFRKTFPELEDVINKSHQFFRIAFPDAKYNASSHTWKFATGEELLLRHFSRPSDYWSYHGHAYPWVGWEELVTWATDQCYTSMFSCVRSTNPSIPSRIRSTANPFGPGHNWVKRRFQLPIAGGTVVGPIIRELDSYGKSMPLRASVHGALRENKLLMFADPDYAQRILASSTNPAMTKAWLQGDWNVTSGGMFDDLWSSQHHIIPDIQPHKIPRGWRIDRSYDHGQSAPFSVGWWAESNGEPMQLVNGNYIGTIPGDLIRFGEWYGWTGRENEGVRMDAYEIGKGIRERELDWGIAKRVMNGPADSSIFDEHNPRQSIYADFKRAGVIWTEADKGPGSRAQGWAALRKMLKDAIPTKEQRGRREFPGLFVCQRCDNFTRTIPVLGRDEKKPDDVDTALEDHIGDETRYRIRRKRNVTTQQAM